jgi:hypothetical protein
MPRNISEDSLPSYFTSTLALLAASDPLGLFHWMNLPLPRQHPNLIQNHTPFGRSLAVIIGTKPSQTPSQYIPILRRILLHRLHQTCSPPVVKFSGKFNEISKIKNNYVGYKTKNYCGDDKGVSSTVLFDVRNGPECLQTHKVISTSTLQ